MSVFALLEKLAPYIEQEVEIAINSELEAGSLSSKLKKVQEALQDTERKGATDQSVRSWLKEVEELMFEMEDALDEWQALNLADQQDEDSIGSTTPLASNINPCDRLRSFVSSLCSCFGHAWERRELVLKMKALSVRLDNILKEKDKYNFVASGGHNNNHKDLEEPISRATTCLLDSSRVYIDREFDKESLVKTILESEAEGTEQRGTVPVPPQQAQIIAIVGVGGVGKTTLAQLAYNHPEVQARFEVRSWVIVGNPFDTMKVARAILEGVNSDKTELMSMPSTLNGVLQSIRQTVTQKKFLLVLDDVWTEERSKWEELKKCLVPGAMPGSRILVTTSNEAVARMMGTTHWQRLGLLSDEDCGMILNAVALEGRSEDQERTKLGEIGMEIAKKCNGLPLAAKTVGSMLALRFSEQELLDVLRSPLWKYDKEGMSDLFRLLKFSYLELDPVLKHCFLSCILFPKGTDLHLDEQVQYWLAYGYISSDNSENEVQLKGRQYFQKLAMRSFVHRLDDRADGVIKFKLHDIMHDFAYYLLENVEQTNCLVMAPSSSKDVRSSAGEHHQRNYPAGSLERLSAFSAARVSREDLPPNLFSHLKRVRLLVAMECGLLEVPIEVGKLIHLTFLDLSGNPLKELPETVTNLCNLQTLNIRGCDKLLRLPNGIHKLRKLRYLQNVFTPSLKEFPQGLQKLTELHALTKFYVTGEDREGSAKLGWLENLNKLQGRLQIVIQAADKVDAQRASLMDKTAMWHLELYFGIFSGMNEVLEALQPPPELKILQVIGSRGLTFPNWMMDPKDCLSKLTDLIIGGFDGCDSLPPFAQLPFLEKLKLQNMEFRRLKTEFFGIHPATTRGALIASGGRKFPRLNTLFFYGCGRWEEWDDIDHGDDHEEVLPSLQKLNFSRCRKLKRLPHNLFRKAKSLEYLGIRCCERLALLYDPETGMEPNKVSHISCIKVMYT